MLNKQQAKFIDILDYYPGIIKDYLRGLETYPNDTEPKPEFDGFMTAVRRLCRRSVRKEIVEYYNKEVYTQDLINVIKENAADWAKSEDFAGLDTTALDKLADNDVFLSCAARRFIEALNRNEAYMQLYKEIAGAVLKETALKQLRLQQSKPIIKEKYRQICEALGWQVHEHYTAFSLFKESPCGEPIRLSMLNNQNLAEKVREAANTFDIEENAEKWVIERYENDNRHVPSLNVLLEDAKAIKEMLKKLACALENV